MIEPGVLLALLFATSSGALDVLSTYFCIEKSKQLVHMEPFRETNPYGVKGTLLAKPIVIAVLFVMAIDLDTTFAVVLAGIGGLWLGAGMHNIEMLNFVFAMEGRLSGHKPPEMSCCNLCKRELGCTKTIHDGDCLDCIALSCAFGEGMKESHQPLVVMP